MPMCMYVEALHWECRDCGPLPDGEMEVEVLVLRQQLWTTTWWWNGSGSIGTETATMDHYLMVKWKWKYWYWDSNCGPLPDGEVEVEVLVLDSNCGPLPDGEVEVEVLVLRQQLWRGLCLAHHSIHYRKAWTASVQNISVFFRFGCLDICAMLLVLLVWSGCLVSERDVSLLWSCP